MQNYNNEIKARIKQIRKDHGYSQAQVVIKDGWSLEVYKKIERDIEKGGIKITAEHLRDLCEVYKLDSADYFLFGKEKSP